MNNKYSKNSRFDFYVIWAFYSTAYYLFWASSLKFKFSFVDTALRICEYITILGALYIFFQQHLKKKNLIIYIFISILCIIIEIYITNREFLMLILFMICAYQIDFKKFISFDLKVKTISILLIILLCLTNISTNIDGYYYGVYKQSFGFQHPNTFASFLFIILLELIYVKFEKLNLIFLLAVELLGIFIMNMTHSRTSSYIFLGVVLLHIIYFIVPKLYNTKIVKIMFALVTPFTAILSIFLTELYIKRTPISIKLNSYLSGRLFLQSQYWTYYKINLFGQTFSELSSNYFLDNSYIRCLLQYGLIFFLFLCIAYSVLLFNCIHRKKIDLALFVLYFILFGFSETSMLRISINVTLLLLLSDNVIFFRKKDKGRSYL